MDTIRVARQRRTRRRQQRASAPRVLRATIIAAASLVGVIVLVLLASLGLFMVAYNHYAAETGMQSRRWIEAF